MSVSPRKRVVLAIAVLLALVMVSLLVGRVALPSNTLFTLWRSDADPLAVLIITELRLPRTVLALLVGAVGVIDLRVLGFARGLPLTALHRFQPIGVAGLVINIITGIGFVASDPLPYLMNGAFRLKLLLMLVAGLNILIFYFVLPREARQLQTNASAPIAARLVAAASLLLWLGVIWAGRFIAFTGKNTL